MMRYPITTERADLFDINMVIGMQIFVKGCAADSEIERAFEKAVASHEILRTRIVLASDGKAFYETTEDSKNTISFTESDFSEIFSREEKIRFKLEDGEFLRAFINLQESGFRALFMMHHLAGDGKSLCFFIETFLNSLSGKETEFYPIRLLAPDDLPQESGLPAIGNFILRHYNKQWQKEKTVFTFHDLEQSHEHFWSTHKTLIAIKHYNKTQLHEMKNEAKKTGCHLTAYMIAGYLRRTPQLLDVGIAVDARNDNNRSMGNQAAGISVKVKYNPGMSFAKNALRIQKMLDKKLSDPMKKFFILHFMAGFDPTLIDAVNMQFTGCFRSKTSGGLAKLLGYSEKTKDLSVTNLTTSGIAICYGDFKLERMLFIPPVISYGKLVVGIITHNNEMNVAVHQYS